MEIKNVQFINAITVNSDVQMCSDSVHIQPIMPETKTLALEVYNPKSKISKKINLILKRIVDIIGAIVGIIFLVPITIVIFIANIISGDFGPLFYSHERIGKMENISRCINLEVCVSILLKD